MNPQGEELVEALRTEILRARERVYHFGSATPIERLVLPEPGPEIWVKREDLSAVKSYKWRGACNRMALLTAGGRKRGVVTASAGNHAQGVALAAKVLGVKARIYMPVSTPRVKQQAVLFHGDGQVEIRLSGESYDEAVIAAREDEATTGAVYVHAYDDLRVMAGQGTLADEVVMSGKGPFDEVHLQIGGGGMAAGVAAWLKSYWPDIRVIGVEGEKQASMKAAFEAGKPVEFEIWVRGEKVGSKGYMVRIGAFAGSALLDFVKSERFAGDSDWTRRSLRLKVPEYTNQLVVAMTLEDEGTIWMDDARLSVVAQP